MVGSEEDRLFNFHLVGAQKGALTGIPDYYYGTVANNARCYLDLLTEDLGKMIWGKRSHPSLRAIL